MGDLQDVVDALGRDVESLVPAYAEYCEQRQLARDPAKVFHRQLPSLDVVEGHLESIDTFFKQDVQKFVPGWTDSEGLSKGPIDTDRSDTYMVLLPTVLDELAKRAPDWPQFATIAEIARPNP